MAACGGDDETTTTASPTDTTAAPTDTTAAPTETTAAQASGDAKVLRMAVPWPVGDPVTDNFQKNFIDKFNAAQTQYKIELHPAGSLLAMPDQFEAVRTGGVEIAGWPTAVFGSIVPEFMLAELPFSVNSIEADAEYNVMMTPIYDKALMAQAQHEDRRQLHLPGPRCHQRRSGEDTGGLEWPALPDHFPGDRQGRANCLAAPEWPWTSPKATRPCRRKSS